MQQEQLFKQIFQQDINDANSDDLLIDVTKEYPYFTAANFFLLKKTSEAIPEYKDRAALAALHFANPFLLTHLLAKKEDKIKNSPATFISTIIAAQNDEPENKNVAEKILLPENPISQPENNISEKTVDKNLLIRENETLEESIPAKEKEELIFEPLYTTDYFASQGIKLSEEMQPADKLGKQLKSFTEWLKTMKKVHESRLPEGSANMDAAVRSLAEKSNKEDAIITEAMAEAYLQQGKTSKALDIYLKLSLLNPAKSAFFAAKIEQLKEK